MRGYVGSAGHESQLWNTIPKCRKWFYDVPRDARSMVGPIRLLFVGHLCGWFYDVPRDACLMVGPVHSLDGTVLQCSMGQYPMLEQESQVRNMIVLVGAR